jgi:hypothetical protein
MWRTWQNNFDNLCKVRTYQDLVAEKGHPQNYRAPHQLRDARSKACAARNAAMVQGCKDYFDNLPADHDENHRRSLIAEKALLPEDDRVSPGTQWNDHDRDSLDLESDEEAPYLMGGPSFAP